jgi:hypothetical protein
MNIGSTRNPQRLTTGDLQRFARELNITPALVMREARDVVQRLRAQIPETTREVTREVGAHPILHHMQEVFARRLIIVESIATDNGVALPPSSVRLTSLFKSIYLPLADAASSEPAVHYVARPCGRRE